MNLAGLNTVLSQYGLPPLANRLHQLGLSHEHLTLRFQDHDFRLTGSAG